MLKNNCFYKLFGHTIYVYDYKPWGGDYKVFYRTIDGKEDSYVGSIYDIREDFSETEDEFTLKPKVDIEKHLQTPEKANIEQKKTTNFYKIVKYYDNSKTKGVVLKKDIFGKDLAYALLGNIKKTNKKDILGVEIQ